MQGDGTGGNVSFNENCKVAGSRLVNRPAGNDQHLPTGRQFLFTSLFSNAGMIADGSIVVFENGLGNELNGHDAKKLLNAGENFGIRRNEILLAVEAHDEVSERDTIFYHFQNLRQQVYQLRFAPVNMQGSLSAFLVDRFNNSSTPVSLTDSSFIDFSISTAVGSAAPDRFILVFRQAIVVPVLIVNIAASKNADQSNQVTWKVENEVNLQLYVVERSVDGADFNAIGSAIPLVNNSGMASYSYRDATGLPLVNFYRIKVISRTGQVQYSNMVKVESVKQPSSIAVYPNPVQDKTIHITFNNQPKGNYIVQLVNSIGQLIYTENLYIDQSYTIQTIRPGNTPAPGTYQLIVIKNDGTKLTEQLVVK